MLNKYVSLLIWIILIGGFIAFQFVPVKLVNPPVEETVPLNEEAERILRKACYDCHSNETRFPWYSNIAPVSLIINHHVEDGRKNLNFSTWNQYTEDRKRQHLEDIAHEIKENSMPPYSYTFIHEDAKLNEVEQQSIYRWAREVADFLDEPGVPKYLPKINF